jgi:peroxiredoxin
VGDKAPEFALIDGSGRKVTMAELLGAPLPSGATKTRGVMLVFYRGYW